MRVECAVLCDAATVREGLLHIIGAGVATTEASQFPHQLPVTFAFRAVLESREQRPEHTLSVRLTEADGRPMAEAKVTFSLRPGEEIVRGQETSFSAPVLLSGFAVQRAGLYLIEASFDEHNVGTFPLRVSHVG